MDEMPYMPIRTEYEYILYTMEDGIRIVTFLDDAFPEDYPAELHAIDVFRNDGGTETIINVEQRYARLTGTGMGLI